MARDEGHTALEREVVAHRGRNEVVPRLERAAIDRALARHDRHAKERVAGARRGIRKGAIEVYAVDGVGGAIDQMRDSIDLGGRDLSRLRGLRFIIDNVKGLVDMQIAQGPVVLTAVVVVQTIGDIAGLLRLENHGPTLNGVHRAGVDLEEITGVDGDLVQDLVPAAFLDGSGELLARGRTLADDDRGVVIAIDDIPALGLAE